MTDMTLPREVLRRTERYVESRLRRRLLDAGLPVHSVGFDEAKRTLASIDLYDRWLEETLRIFRDVQMTSARSRSVEAEPPAPPAEQATACQLALAERTLEALPEILAGRIRATDLIFPSGSTHLVDGIYRGNPLADHFNRLLAKTVSQAVAAWRAEGPEGVRILEIGAGTGGTTTMVLEMLDRTEGAVAEYLFTDLSQTFLTGGRGRFAQGRDYFRTAILDVEKPLEQQGIVPARYDIVLATNVLHATRDVRQTLRHLKEALRTNGLLILNELTRNSLLNHVTFGLLAGWWRYEDPGLRLAGSPVLARETWLHLLGSEGFRGAFSLGGEGDPAGQHVIVAESDGMLLHRTEGSDIAAEPGEIGTQDSTTTLATEMVQERPASASLEERLIEKLRDIVAALSKLPREEIDPASELAEYGFDSISFAQLANRLNGELSLSVPVMIFFDHSSLASAARHLVATQQTDIARALGAAPAKEALARKEPDDDASDPPVLTAAVPSEMRGDGRPAHRQDLGHYPLSHQQKALWTLDQVEELGASYNVPLVLALRGPLDRMALERSLKAIVSRHPALRARFAVHEDDVRQIIEADTDLRLAFTDFQSAPAGEREAAIGEATRSFVRGPFDLSAGDLMRAALFALGPTDHRLVLAFHHIVIDGWSLGLFARELSALYRMFALGQWAAIAEPGLSYGDYALWQRDRLADPGLAADLAAWKERLADAPPLITFPADRARPARQSFNGRTLAFSFSEELTAGLKGLAQATGTTFFTVLMAGFQALTHRLTGEDDIVTGTVVTNRPRSEFEDVIGLFAGAVPLRTDCGGDITFRTLLQRVKESASDAFSRADVPFDRLVETLNPERDLSYNPIFQTAFTLQRENPLFQAKGDETGQDGVELAPGLCVALLDSDVASTMFDLSLDVYDREGAAAAKLEYASDLYDDATARSFADRYLSILAAAVADPDQPLARLPLMDEVVRSRVLDWSQGPAVEAPVEPSVHARISARAARAPQAVAVVAKDGELTFEQLERETDALAARLVEQGISRGSVVGVHHPVSRGLLIAFVAILKAGGIYLPLDPGQPVERLRLMAEDASACLILSSSGGDEFAAAGLRVLDESALPAGLALEPVEIGPEDCAYLIFTSGSTGRPKGVAVTHGNLLNLMAGQPKELAFGLKTRVFATSAPSFDLSVEQLLLPLMSGGATVLASEMALRSAAQFWDEIRTTGVDTLDMTPAHLSAMLDECPPDISLSRIILGGESVDPALVQRLRHHFPAAVIANAYGPTEATIGATCHVVSEEVSGPRLPIGRPFGGVATYVLDPHQELCPPGIPGELWIGGAGIAKGYVGRPELTAERFHVDPFAEDSSRVYRTGDHVRWTHDGQLDFLGRLDDQVKIRGHRIELGEIKAALLTLPEIAEAAVVLCGEETAKRCVAYVVPRPGTSTDEQAVRTALAHRLPPAMVPSAIVTIDRIPMTRNGKVDRAALPVADRARIAALTPESETEQLIAGLFRSVLNIEDVDRTSSFFDLGGDSISAIQLVGRARRAGLAIEPRRVFEYPSVAALAHSLDADAPTPILPRATSPTTMQVPATPIMRWMLTKGGPLDRFSQSMIFTPPLDLGRAAVIRGLDAVIRRHDAFRMRLQNGPENAVLAFGDAESFDPAAMLPPEGETLSIEEALDRTRDRLDSTTGRMAAASFVAPAGDGPDRLLVTIHHFTVDGVSWRIIHDDLYEAWNDLAAGRQPELPPPPTSFAAWCDQLNERACSDAVTSETAFWEGMAEAPAAPISPEPLSAEKDRVATAAHGSSRFDVASTAGLLAAADSMAGGRVDRTLLACILSVLAEMGGTGALLVNVEGHGRQASADLDLSETVGWFTSLTPLLVRRTGSDAAMGGGFRSWLEGIEGAFEALPSSGEGFGLLRWCNPQTSSSFARLPEPKICFNYLGRLAEEPDGSGLGSLVAGSDPDMPLGHVLEVDCALVDRQDGPILTLHWTAASCLLPEQRLGEIVLRTENAIRSLAGAGQP